MKYRFTNRTGGASSGAFASLNLGTHVSDDLETVLEHGAVVFHFFRVPAGADAELKPAVGDQVERRDDLRQHDWIVFGDQTNTGAKA